MLRSKASEKKNRDNSESQVRHGKSFGDSLGRDIIGKKVVDRLPVLVSDLERYELLGEPKVANTGRSMADAVSALVEDWDVKQKLVAMCFNATS